MINTSLIGITYIECPECELQISDKARTCPHCGYPLQPDAKYKPRKKQHMRLPNGFGQITELKNPNLRKPFRVMVTVGKTAEGKPICKILKPEGYFKTYNEAYAALVEYNKNPYDLDASMLMYELYDRWSTEYFAKLENDSSKRTIKSSWNYCSEIYNMRVKDVRARHIKACMENGSYNGKTTTPNIKSRIKSMFNLMFDYALEYELVDKNYARTFNLSDDVVNQIEENRKEHVSFTNEELNILWDNSSVPLVNMVLVQCYMGWRPQEK